MDELDKNDKLAREVLLNLQPEDKISSKRRWSKVVIIFAVFLILFLIPIMIIHYMYPTTSPFKAISYINYRRSHPHAELSQRAVGYAPYWQLDKMGSIRLDLLSDVIYFSLSVDENGNFSKKNAKGEDDPGFKAWNEKPANDLLAKTEILGGQTGLTVAVLNNDKIKNFLSSEESQKNLIDSTIKEVKRKHLKVINVDFEYTGKPADDLPGKYTSFIGRMRSEFDKKVPGTELDINLMARSGRSPGLFEIEKLRSSVDKFIVMSYDYYTGGSDSAGPVAPMNGFAEKKYFFDVTTTYDDLAKIVSADEIIMGVPYYGYDWPVKDKDNPRSLALKQSDENGYVETLSYGRARAEEIFSGDNCKFDALAKEEWCGYADPETGKDRVAWFENNQSIKIKYDFAKDRNFAGVAIWTLGYDRDYPDLWDILKESFAK